MTSCEMAFAATTSSLTTAQAHCPSDDNIRHGTMTRYGLCTGFKNVPGRERTLLRLWLRAHEHYPMARGFVEIADILNQQHSEGWSMLVNTDESLRAAYELMKG